MPRERHAFVLGLGGSLGSRPSRSLTALEVALQAAEAAGAKVRLFDLRALDLPLFAPGEAPVPATQEYADAVFEADGLIWSSPMYHGTISGSFKNALDWLDLLAKRDPPYLTDKVVGLIGSAGGAGGSAFDGDGNLVDERAAAQCATSARRSRSSACSAGRGCLRPATTRS